MKNSILNLLAILTLLFFASCKDDDEEIKSYEIPATYSFDNVSYDGQTQRLSQFTELKSYMTTSRTAGVSLDAARMQAMYENDAANASWQGSYEDSKQMKSKTFANVQEDFVALLNELASASASTEVGSEGVSGVISSNDGAKSYLIGDDGLDHAQLIEKGLMGALLYYQSTGVYLESERMDVDNIDITPGEGTEMEHHWDEAFGYLGVATDFPTNLDNAVFWGNYTNLRDAILGSNQKLMDAFLKGRAAISNDDLEARDEAIETIKTEWELVSVGSALHYLNSGIANFDDMSLRAHALSEGIGFIYSLQFNPDKKITNAQVSELLEIIASSADFDQMNLYTTSIDKLQEAKDKLAAYYSLDDKKDEF